MPVSVNWDDNAHTLICFRIAGHWTWQEFNWAWLESVAMLNSVPHKVHTIIDIADNISVPPDLLTQSVNLVRLQPRNTGLAFIITNSGFLNLLLATLKRIIPRESAYLRSVPNVEAARRTLAAMA